MHSNVHPLILVGAGSFLVALVAAFCAWWVKRRLFRVLLVLVALVFVMPAGLDLTVFYPVIVDGRYYTFKQFYHDIKPGMTRAQVLATMDRHYPVGGGRRIPNICEDNVRFLCIYMDPEEERVPNNEGIFLTLDNGKVTKIAYGED